MLKKSKKIKIRGGKDSNQSIMRKLVTNTFLHAKITTTLKRANYIKAAIDRIINYAKAGKRILVMQKLNDKAVTEKVMTAYVKALGDRNSGYMKMTRMGKRLGDDAEMIKLEFVNAIVEEKQEPVVKGKAVKTTKKVEKVEVEKIEEAEVVTK